MDEEQGVLEDDHSLYFGPRELPCELRRVEHVRDKGVVVESSRFGCNCNHSFPTCNSNCNGISHDLEESSILKKSWPHGTHLSGSMGQCPLLLQTPILEVGVAKPVAMTAGL